MGRKLKYAFDKMVVDEDKPMKVNAIKCYSVVQCAINWARKKDNGWKFRSERSGKFIKLWRIV